MDTATQSTPPSAPPPQPAGTAPPLNYAATTERVRIGFLMRFVAFVLQPEHLALHDKLFKTAVFGPPTVQFTIPKASDILPTQSEIAAAQGAAAAAAHPPSQPTPPPAA